MPGIPQRRPATRVPMLMAFGFHDYPPAAPPPGAADLLLKDAEPEQADAVRIVHGSSTG